MWRAQLDAVYYESGKDTTTQDRPRANVHRGTGRSDLLTI